jgi:hypothetical protein
MHCEGVGRALKGYDHHHCYKMALSSTKVKGQQPLDYIGEMNCGWNSNSSMPLSNLERSNAFKKSRNN